MGVDIRVPLGAMFTMLGVLLAAYGAFGDKTIYARTLGINVNLEWGAVLLVFGVLMLFLGLRTRPEGRAASDDAIERRPGGH